MFLWRTTVEVAASSRSIVDVPAFTSLTAPRIHATPARSISMLGIVVGSLGLASVGAGTYFGVVAFRDENRSKQHCTGSTCSPDGVSFNRDARHDALISDLAIGVGGAALITGVVLVVRSLSPSAHDQLQAWTDGGSVGFATSW